MSHRLVLAVLLAAGLAALGSAARAEEPPPTRAQVEQLQKQLAEMQKEMESMRAALAQGSACPQMQAQMPQMQSHMQGMQHHWQMMHDQACTMAPGTCPHMGMAPGAAPPAAP